MYLNIWNPQLLSVVEGLLRMPTTEQRLLIPPKRHLHDTKISTEADPALKNGEEGRQIKTPEQTVEAYI